MLGSLVGFGDLEKPISFADGPRFKKFIVSKLGIPLDLFIVRKPAQFGWVYLLRTGPALFSKRMVTKRFEKGLMPNGLYSDRAAIRDVRTGEVKLTPTEQDVFELFVLAFIPPEKRK